MAGKQEIIEAIIKSNIGDVAEGIDKAAKSTEDLSKSTDKLDGGLKKAKGGVKSLGLGFKTLAKASGIIFLLNKAFEVFQEVLGKNQKSADFFSIAMETLSIAFNDLFKFIESNIGPVVEWFKQLFEDPGTKIKEMGTAIKDGLVARFKEFVEVLGLAGKALGELVTGNFSEAFDTIKEAGKQLVDVYTGVDGSFEIVKENIKKGVEAIKDYTLATIDQATALVEAEKTANRAGVEFAKLNAEYLKQAEELRQVRDDTTKTFAERIQANKDLNDVLAKQQELQKEAIQKQIAYAQQQYNINASEENYIALQEAKVSMLELEETITGQLSEQKTNSVALAQELIDAENELAKVGKTNRDLELEELQQGYEAKLELARKAGQDSALVDEEYRIMKGEINDAYDQEELEKAEAIAAAKKEVMFAMLQGITDNIQQSLDERSAKVEEDYQREMELAEGNEAEQKKIEKKFEKRRKEEAKKQKKLQVALALIDTYKGGAAAFTSTASIPMVGPALAPFAAAAAVMAGLANVRKIMKQDVGGGSGGGGAGGGGGATPPPTPQPPAPEMMSGKFELSGGQEPEPIKAFVVTDEMTNSQDQLEEIRNESTL